MNERSELSILCWDGYDSDVVLDRFTRDRRITASGETLLSDFEAAERLARGDASDFDIINLNNPFTRDYLFPRGLITPLDRERFEPFFDRMLPQFRDLYAWAYTEDGAQLLGICQRFGPFNIVANTKRVSRAEVEQMGFGIVNERNLRGRYAILDYPDFNAFHIAITAGLDPFTDLSEDDLAAFAESAATWYRGARLVTGDHIVLNRKLIDGDIDFYLSGGVYTASPARLAGHTNIRAITPLSGPIDGKGGIVFMEVTSALSDCDPVAIDFLEYLLSPRVAIDIAFFQNTCNPVAQMGDPEVMAAFSKAQLDAIQWDTLEEDISRCAHYRLAPQYPRMLEIMRNCRRTE